MIFLGPWLAVLGGVLQAAGGYFNILTWHSAAILSDEVG